MLSAANHQGIVREFHIVWTVVTLLNQQTSYRVTVIVPVTVDWIGF